jgi:hypothetical protein
MEWYELGFFTIQSIVFFYALDNCKTESNIEKIENDEAFYKTRMEILSLKEQIINLSKQISNILRLVNSMDSEELDKFNNKQMAIESILTLEDIQFIVQLSIDLNKTLKTIKNKTIKCSEYKKLKDKLIYLEEIKAEMWRKGSTGVLSCIKSYDKNFELTVKMSRKYFDTM